MIEHLVSVIIPCYKQAQYLPVAIDSVLAQSYENWECIIVNDGSPDETEEVAGQYILKDKRIKYVIKTNGGLPSARNEGIKNAKGELILPLDADDKIGKDYLLLAVRHFVENKQTKLVYCKAEYFGGKSGVWNLPPFDFKTLAYTNLIFCTAFFRKSEWERVGGYDGEMRDGHEDWEFWINILKNEKNSNVVYRLDYVGFFYRIKESSMFVNIPNEYTIKAQSYASKKHADFIYEMLGDPITLYKKLEFYKGRILRIENLFVYKFLKKFKFFL